MKQLKGIGLLVMVMLFMMPLQVRAEGLGHARLSLEEGDVQIRSEDSSEWFPASVNMPLREGDSLWLPEGARAEIQLAGGTQVRIEERSSLDLLNLDMNSAQLYLKEGSAHINFRDGRSNSFIQLDTPKSSVRAYDRAVFGVDVTDSGNTDVSVYTGAVYAESGSGSTRVAAGNMLEISEEYADLYPLGRADAWERWNMERDRRFEERRHSLRYLPEELEPYAGDFDEYGRWVSIRDYGYVWTPTVQISVGWSPYRNGRWSWIGGDYVWVGYEPWGWAPYHYGRWDYAVSVGWFWIPPARGSVFWGPGYVGWVRTPTYVAWVPLAPREIYYGRGHYGPHSVNITNVNINTIVVKNRYKNVHVTNSVTVQHHDTFVKGRHVDFKVKHNPFLKEKIHVGRPDIKPERETRMAVIRDIPRAKEPPTKIREVQIREIRQARPMVKDREKSVFRPDKAHQQLNVKPVETPKERKRNRAEERSSDWNRKLKGPEAPQIQEMKKEITPAEKRSLDERRIRQQIEERKKELTPAEKKGPDSKPDPKNGRQQEGERMMRRQKETLPGSITPPVQPAPKREQHQSELQDRKSAQPGQEIKQPENPQKKETTAPQGIPDKPMVKQTERLPFQNRQMQRPGQPPVQPRQGMPEPERLKMRDPGKTDEKAPEPPKIKQPERPPVPDRLMQREERKQRQSDRQDKRLEQQKQKVEKLKKEREEKDEQKKSGEGAQQPPAK